MSRPDPGPGTLARRVFLRKVGRASAGALCGAALPALASCGGMRYATATRTGGALRVEEAELGSDDAVLVASPLDARPIFLWRAGDGRYVAVSTRCAHRGCQVQRQGPRLACPCHGSEYELDGALLEGPADRPLRRFPTRVRDGAVLIVLEPEGGDR